MVQRKIVYEGLCCCGVTEYLSVNARCMDSMPFLAMAMVRNEGCRKALEKYKKVDKEQLLSAYRRTVYAYSCFLENFILEEREDARIALGMIQLVREEAPEEKRYNEWIKILSEGFRTEKSMIQKQIKVNGQFLEKVMEQKLPVNALIPEMMVQLVLAEELGVAIERDPAFYRVMRRMEEHLKSWIQEETWEATEQGKSFYNKLCKEHQNPENWFAGSWSMEYANELNDVIMIMNQFYLKEQILNKLSLEKKEAEILCSLDRNMDWNTYRRKLLIASLCKYIHEIQVAYEENMQKRESG